MEGQSKCFLTSWWNMKNGTQKRKLARIEDEAKRIVVAVAKKKNGLKCITACGEEKVVKYRWLLNSGPQSSSSAHLAWLATE